MDPVLPEAEEREIVSTLSRLVVGDHAPDELPFFDEAAIEFFEDPDAAAKPASEESLGFGLELAMMTPALLAAMTAVVRFVASIALDVALAESTSQLSMVVRRLFGISKPGVDANPPALSVPDARRVRQVAVDRLSAAGVQADEASFLADAIVGRLFIEPR